jgi:hypothetical protein
MLFRRLFIASNPKNLSGNPAWYIEWLGTVDRQYLAWCSDLRTPPPFFCGNPPPPPTWGMIGDEYGYGTLTVSLVYLAAWAEYGKAIPKDFHVLSFDSSVTVLQKNRVVGFSNLLIVGLVGETIIFFIISIENIRRNFLYIWGNFGRLSHIIFCTAIELKKKIVYVFLKEIVPCLVVKNCVLQYLNIREA